MIASSSNSTSHPPVAELPPDHAPAHVSQGLGNTSADMSGPGSQPTPLTPGRQYDHGVRPHPPAPATPAAGPGRSPCWRRSGICPPRWWPMPVCAAMFRCGWRLRESGRSWPARGTLGACCTNRADPDMPFPDVAAVAEAGPANNPERRATPVIAQIRFPRIPTYPPFAFPPPPRIAARLNCQSGKHPPFAPSQALERCRAAPSPVSRRSSMPGGAPFNDLGAGITKLTRATTAATYAFPRASD